MYIASAVAVTGAMALVFGLVRVPGAGGWIGGALATLFTTAAVYSAVVMNRNPRAIATPAHRQMRRVLNALFVVLVSMNLLLVFSGGATASFALINRVMSVTPLLFLSATTFYENRFEFYDLVVKRGALLLAGVLLLGGAFAVLLPWLDGLPHGASRPWLFALTTVPLMLAAPWLAGLLGQALDRAWFGRHHTPVSAVTSVLASLQSATDEALAPRRRRSRIEGRARRHRAAGHRAAAGQSRHAHRLRGGRDGGRSEPVGVRPVGAG